MRNGTLHAALEAFTLDVAGALQSEREKGAEVPFELVEEAGGPTPLYCYRSLTGNFINARLGLLSALPTYAAAARALASIVTVGAYLRQRGVPRIPSRPCERTRLALELFLSAAFAERSRFEFDRGRFEAAFAELERSVYQGRCVTTALAPLRGVALDRRTRKVALGGGLALVRGEDFEEAPYEAVWGEGEASVLVVFTVVQDRRAAAPVALVRSQLRRVVSTLRLFEAGAYALGPSAWMRVDGGSWRAVALPFSGDPGPARVIAASEEDELRGFFNLVSRRAAASAALAWSLARFEMAAERPAPLESLTDYLLAARALLEPEGSASYRLADRLAAICANPAERLQVSAHIERALVLERLAIAGQAVPDRDTEATVAALREHVRALLRDMLCGHLDGDVCALADELLRESRVAAVQVVPDALREQAAPPDEAADAPLDQAANAPADRAADAPLDQAAGDPTAEVQLRIDEVGLGADR
jgi:hypothetical protein